MSPQSYLTHNVAPQGDEIHFIGAGYFEPKSPQQLGEGLQVQNGDDAKYDSKQVDDINNAESTDH